MRGVHVRPATTADVATMIRFIHELAVYEREPEAVHITSDQLQQALFGPTPHLFGHVVEVGGDVAGMAIWFLNFSTWEGTHGIYLEDLYVTPQHRAVGAGRAMLGELARVCVGNGYARLELSVLGWNAPAIGFYSSLGAISMDDWTVQRVTGEALRTLAGR